jgi:hypothetical protein
MDIDILKDERANCYSVMVHSSIENYLEKVRQIFENRGGIEGQRDTQKTITAKRIRERMVSDLKEGAVLPPIVLGVILSENEFNELEHLEDEASFNRILVSKDNEDIFIIDGMQRTTALKEAVEQSPGIKKQSIRVEYWLAAQSNAMTYRMLVLNTGQVPWSLRRQIEVVFQPILKELEQQNPEIEVIAIDDSRRATKAGQFQKNAVVELFLVFGSRTEKIDLNEKVADEFTKQDFIESTSRPEFTEEFYKTIDYLIRFEKALGKQSFFKKQPASYTGFVTAIALHTMGRPGGDHSREEREKKWKTLEEHIEPFIRKIESFSDEEREEFVCLEILKELTSKTGKTKGYENRKFFKEAFKVLIDDKFEVKSMEVCWRTY